MKRLGVIVLVGCWLPLLAVALVDPDSNPIGLGLLGMAGTAAGVLLIVLGWVMSLFRGAD
jgi:hypothetical protein